MLRGLAAERGWPVLDGTRLRGLPELPEAGAAGLALDDADCAPEEAALLHLINICAERGQRLLLAGREPPARWPVALPDLRSRLRATAVAAVRPPEDALLAALLRKHFADRQLRLDPALAGLAAAAPAAGGGGGGRGRVPARPRRPGLRRQGDPEPRRFGPRRTRMTTTFVAVAEAASTSPRLL